MDPDSISFIFHATYDLLLRQVNCHAGNPSMNNACSSARVEGVWNTAHPCKLLKVHGEVFMATLPGAALLAESCCSQAGESCGQLVCAGRKEVRYRDNTPNCQLPKPILTTGLQWELGDVMQSIPRVPLRLNQRPSRRSHLAQEGKTTNPGRAGSALGG